MYHTQEKWQAPLTFPIICQRDDAWLGVGYYFWYDELDAIKWGHIGKKRTGHFEIYSAKINCDNVLDTVFNEEHYNFWRKQIEKVASKIIKLTNKKPTVREINLYIAEKAKWAEKADGIMFQDLPFGADLLVERFNYRKRIQLVAYNDKIIANFTFSDSMECVRQ